MTTHNQDAPQTPALFNYANCSSFLVTVNNANGALAHAYSNGIYTPKSPVSLVPVGSQMTSLGLSPDKTFYSTHYGYLKSEDVSVSSPTVDNTITVLKNMAMDDTWSYSRTTSRRANPILYNYLLHTFAKIEEEGKILSKGNFSCFNTGLVTPNQQEIYMVFKMNQRLGKWLFLEFCKESSNTMTKFDSLPLRATYFTDPSELIYDPRLPLRINIDHIIDDTVNFARFPESIRSLPKLQIVNTFNGAISHAKKRIERNYKTAIPQYYRGYIQGAQLQLLLPLCLTDPAKADLALAVYKNNGSYMGRTCLTLDMAINNARLIAKPDDEWLKP